MKKIVALVMVIGIVFGTVYTKANKVRECEVLGVYEDAMSVVHPNGHIYTLHIDEEYVGRYHKGEIVDVVFDELYEWDTQYEVKGLKY